jgi:signal transduction histidine kinase
MIDVQPAAERHQPSDRAAAGPKLGSHPDYSDARRLFSLLARIAAIEFLVEILIMMTFSSWILTRDVVLWSLLDATLLTMCAAPLIYVFAARPYAVAAHEARTRLAYELHDKALRATQLEDVLQKLRNSMSQNEQLQNTLRQANLSIEKSNERVLQKIGADLHDGPAQLLSYALLRMNKLSSAVARSENSPDLEELQKLRDAVADSLREVRHISTGLSPPGLETASLREAILLAIALHEQQTGTTVHTHIQTTNTPISDSVKVCAYRVVQEALANSYRHARAKGQSVKVECSDVLRLSVTDLGPGFVPEAEFKSGLGLSGMRARIESLGGRFRLDSTPGEGTRVVIEFDLEPHHSGNGADG